MIFRQLHEPSSAVLSYLIADSVTRKAAIIDGVLGQASVYLKAMKQLGLVLEYLLETHVHEDHKSVSPQLKQVTPARLAVHEQGEVRCADTHLRDGDDVSPVQSLDSAGFRALLGQGQMPSGFKEWAPT